MKPESSVFMQGVASLTAWDRTDNRVTQCVHAMGLFIQGEAERKIRFFTGVSAGNLHRLAIDLGWILWGTLQTLLWFRKLVLGFAGEF